MRTKMAEAIRNSIPEKKADGVAHTAPEYMALVQTQFTGSSKFYCRTLIDQFLNTKYTGGGVRKHILKLSNIHGKLAALDMKLPEDFLVHTIFRSLPPTFSSFEISYNSLEEKWDLQKLIGRCVQDEDRMIAQGGGQINYVHHHQKKKPFPKHFKAKNQWESGPSNAPNQKKGKAPLQLLERPNKPQGKKKIAKDTCLHCGKKGHWQNKCSDWLEMMWNKGAKYEPDASKRIKRD
ncbi:unnamed protein product [Urochloa humidicola]